MEKKINDSLRAQIGEHLVSRQTYLDNGNKQIHSSYKTHEYEFVRPEENAVIASIKCGLCQDNILVIILSGKLWGYFNKKCYNYFKIAAVSFGLALLALVVIAVLFNQYIWTRIPLCIILSLVSIGIIFSYMFATLDFDYGITTLGFNIIKLKQYKKLIGKTYVKTVVDDIDLKQYAEIERKFNEEVKKNSKDNSYYKTGHREYIFSNFEGHIIFKVCSGESTWQKPKSS